MLTVLCVLKSGGGYNAESVDRLRRAVGRHLSVPHIFDCLSDVPVPCNRIPLAQGWPGWWSKIELFRPGVINGPTLYLDLDTVLVGSIDKLASFDFDFGIMRNLNMPHMPGSAVMWFSGQNVPHDIYHIFKGNPDYYMAQYSDRTEGAYLGDQAFIWDALDRKVRYLSDHVPGLIRSYRRHCAAGVPEGCSVVAFGGDKKPWNVPEAWVKEAYS